MQCDGCPYERQGRQSKHGTESIPAGFLRLRGMVLCPQCQEMYATMFEKSTGRAFGYLRASSTKQEITIDAQRRAIKEYCKMRGLEIVDFFIDKASARKHRFHSRPAGGQIFSSVQEGDHVVIAKYDRGFRDVADAVMLFKRWVRQRVCLHFAMEGGLVPPTAAGKFILTMMIAAAEHEADTMSERQRTSQRERRQQMNIPVGRFPITGFIPKWVPRLKNGKKVQKKILVLNPDERDNAILFHDLHFDDGISYAKLSRFAKDTGIVVPDNVIELDPRIHKHYSRQRIKRLVDLESELRVVQEHHPHRTLDLKELGDEWLKTFYITDRTNVTFAHVTRQRERDQPDLLSIVGAVAEDME